MGIGIVRDGAEVLGHVVQRAPLRQTDETTEFGLRGSGGGNRCVGSRLPRAKQAADDQDRRCRKGERDDVPTVGLFHEMCGAATELAWGLSKPTRDAVHSFEHLRTVTPEERGVQFLVWIRRGGGLQRR